MTRGLPPLAWLRSFEAAARHAGFTNAADELGMPPAAVGQHARAGPHGLDDNSAHVIELTAGDGILYASIAGFTADKIYWIHHDTHRFFCLRAEIEVACVRVWRGEYSICRARLAFDGYALQSAVLHNLDVLRLAASGTAAEIH